MVGDRIAYESPLGKSDHSCLVFEFRCSLQMSSCSNRTIQLFHAAIFSALKDESDSAKWESLLDDGNIQEMYNKFCEIYRHICNMHIPN